jgi:hypothetical protein
MELCQQIQVEKAAGIGRAVCIRGSGAEDHHEMSFSLP